MRTRELWLAILVAVALVAVALVGGCGGSTGSGLVTFGAFAAGPVDAPGGGPWAFDTPAGFRVTLQRATLHVGAIYLNASVPISGAQESSCILPGVYVAEVTRGRDVDLLDPEPQVFPVSGQGKADPAKSGEVWLIGDVNPGASTEARQPIDVNAATDSTPILDLLGSASDGARTVEFSAALTIGANRAVKSANAAQPGAHPLCKERIVTPIPTTVTPQSGGRLVLRIDPRALVASVNFTDADFLATNGSSDSSSAGSSVVFDDHAGTTPSRTLYQALHAAALTYRFEWSPAAAP